MGATLWSPFRGRCSNANAPILPLPTNCQLSPSSASPAPNPTPPPSPHNQHDFIVIHKNARSLCKDDSIDELTKELEDTPWHVITINETWRMHRRELFKTKDDHHIFAGSGHNEPTRGVGFLIHKSYSHCIRNFNAVDERIAYVDIIVNSCKLRVITSYFPHSGYGDTSIQRL